MYKKDTVKWGQIMEKTKELSTIEVPRYIGGKNSQLSAFVMLQRMLMRQQST